MKICRSIVFIAASLFISAGMWAQPVRIMPMGNSITYDDNVADKTNPRDTNDRVSYRYRLYQLITEKGYDFDYVGSENSGNNFFMNDEYDDNAGFPGINDGQMANLINTGYNLREKKYEAPGPYLLYYPADIILLHIGTNDLDSSSADVRNILDNIRSFDQHVIILVARIINRDPYSALTTTFNDHVEAMVKSRNDSRIISVDMENGAGINYSTDMADYLHPNTRGFNKMAVKWFDALDHLNSAPVISTIPSQKVSQGTAFNHINLDQYVTDKEDQAGQIEWLSLNPGSNLNVVIENRILKVSLKDSKWYGSENVILKALDSGSGSFRKSDTVSVTFTVEKVNIAPQIVSEPTTSVQEDSNYFYKIIAVDNNNDQLFYSIVQKPEWLAYNTDSHELTGTPRNQNVGSYTVTIHVSDGEASAEQKFVLDVINTNDAPVIDSSPDTSIIAGSEYSYSFHASDVDLNDILAYTAITKPDWLDLSRNGSGAFLKGTPANADAGPNNVELSVNDGHISVQQKFIIHVKFQTAIEYHKTVDFMIFPNPTQGEINLVSGSAGSFNFILYDLEGRLIKNISTQGAVNLKIDLSELSEAVYVYKALIDNHIVNGKICIAK